MLVFSLHILQAFSVTASPTWVMCLQIIDDTCHFIFRCESLRQFTDSALKTNAASFLAASSSYYSYTWRNNSEDLLPQYEIRFATNKIVSALCHFQRVKRQLSRYTGTFSPLSLSLSLSLHLWLVAQAIKLVFLIIVLHEYHLRLWKTL